jgi:Zn-dependent membrane protease YugP
LSIAAAVFIVAVGAILRYAVNDDIQGVDLQTVGLILMIAGIVGLVITLFVEFSGRRRAGRYVEVRDERDLPPPRY